MLTMKSKELRFVATAAEAWAAELVVKVKEPLASEYQFLRDDLLLFTYLHMAAAPELADAMLAAKTTGVAYETVRNTEGQLPLLVPMSEVAGRMAVQIGAHFLTKTSWWFWSSFRWCPRCTKRKSNHYWWWCRWYTRSTYRSWFRSSSNYS